jgi:predicted MFS family arabinose efflux permease
MAQNRCVNPKDSFGEPIQRDVSSLPGIGARARRRVAYRLLPFVLLLYVVNYIDRVNVSFANLRMGGDLEFSDRAYGLGVGMFYLTYVLFEIPGAIIVERWSARKWIERMMISWGVVTILTGLVHTTGQFYTARFFLGLAEASFFPGMIVYLTHWFRSRERGPALACLYIAVPTASLVGSPIAGWLPGVHWWQLAGWRWLFILEYGALIAGRRNFALAISCLLLGSGVLQAFYPLFWSIPTTILSESAAAATFGLINSIGQLGGLVGSYVIGFLNDRTHSLTASFGFIALLYVVAASLILSLKIRDPLQI